MSTNGSTTKDIKIPYPSEGIIRTAALDDTVTPEGSVQLGVNINFDQVGAFKTRKGIEQYTTPGGAFQIRALGTYANFASSTFQLLSQGGNGGFSIYMSTTAGTSTLKRTTTYNTKARFAQFLNLTWMVNGFGKDAVQTYDGSAFGTTQVPSGFPTGDFIQAGFEGRVWVGQKANDVIYYTDIVQFTPPSTYTLTFDVNTNFIKNFSPQNGETMTGFMVTPRALLVFKQNSIYRVYGATSVDAYPAYNVGTYSQESIVQTKDGIYFHHSSGFYKFAYDSQPIEISRRVIDFVRAISRTEYENISGIWDGYDSIKWAVGAVTVEGVTYTNCVMRYTISTQVWTIYDYGSHNLEAMVRYDTGTTILNMVGTAAGRIGIIGTSNKDFDDHISFEFIDRWRSYTEMYAKSKIISGFSVYHDNGAGTRLEYQIKKDMPNKWHPIGTLDQNSNTLIPNIKTLDFNVSRLRLVGVTSGDPIVFHGIELMSLQDEGYEEN